MIFQNDSVETVLTEPVIVPDLIVNGFVITTSSHITRFVGWVISPSVDGGADERRIIQRFVMPNDTARKFARDLLRSLPTGN